MRAANTYLLILTLSCYALACSTAKPVEQAQSPLIGDYHYVSYDQKGERVVEGTLSITSVEKKRINSDEVIEVKGTWQLRKVGSQERIGMQEGSGEFIGSVIEGELSLNLNPNISDANVYLRGRVEGKRYQGRWTLRGYAGTLNEGTFEAIRK